MKEETVNETQIEKSQPQIQHSIDVETNHLLQNNLPRSHSLIRSNLHASSLTILNYTIGITIMFLPKYLTIAGVGLGSFLLFFFALMNYVTCYILVYSARKLNIISYYDIGDKIFSPQQMKYFTFFYLAVLYGNVLIYQQFAIQIISFAVQICFSLKISAYNVYLTVGVTIFTHMIIIPFLLQDNMNLLRILSKACSYSFFFAVGILVTAFFVPEIFGIHIKPIDESKIQWFSERGLYLSFGFYMLGYVQQLIVIEVDQEVRPNNLNSSNKVLISSSIQSFLLYFTVSVIGYFTIYQEDHKGLDNYLIFLMKNEKFQSKFFIIANILVAFGALFGNALNFYPMVNFFNMRLNQKKKKISLKMLLVIQMDEEDLEDYEAMTEEFLSARRRRNRIKIVMYLFTVVLLSLIVFTFFNLSMDWLFTFVSAFAVPPISFVFPFLLYNQIIKGGYITSNIKLHKILCKLGIGLGSFIWLFTLISLFKSNLTNDEEI